MVLKRLSRAQRNRGQGRARCPRVGNYIKEVARVNREMFKAVGCMLEEEHLRYIEMMSATGDTEN